MKPLPPADAMFLWLETRNQPMHVAGLNIYTPPAHRGEDFIVELESTWRAFTRALPPFNLRPVFRLGVWCWEEDKDFELDYHVRRLALPRPGRIRELLAIVARLHGNLMDRNRPLWEAYIIEGLPGGRFATYVKIHHALIDGVTGSKMMAQSLARKPDDQRAPLWAFEFPKRSVAEATSAPERAIKSLIGAARAGKEILPGIGSGLWDVIRSSQIGSGEALPLQAPPTPFNVDISASRRFAAQSYSLERFRTLGHAVGATVNDITLAICAGALRKYLLAQNELPKKPLIAMVPVSLHDSTTEGNQVGMLLANLGTDVADPVKRLKGIIQSTTVAKNRLLKMSRLEKMAHGMVMMVPAAPLMLTGGARKHPMFNVVISNVPGPKDTLYLNGARLDEVYPVSIPTAYLALNITITGYGDRLGFGYTACRRSVPNLQRMLDYTHESIDELEAALLVGVKTSAVPLKPKRSQPPSSRKISSNKLGAPKSAAVKPRMPRTGGVVKDTNVGTSKSKMPAPKITVRTKGAAILKQAKLPKRKVSM